MFKEMLDRVKNTRPLIHNITNYVTANDCANILLACGGSAIMADEPEEVEEITSICSGLNLNLGTINERTIPSMLLAGKKANKRRSPVVLDPVGVGASSRRTKTALELLGNIRFSVIRGNISEIRALASGTGATRGVDASPDDTVNAETLPRTVLFAKEFSRKTGAVIAITGAIDIVADSQTAYCIHNGHPMMSRVTGTGCQLSSMTAAYIAANPDTVLTAAAAAVCAMGVCGEKAYARLTPEDGNAAYRNYLIDAVYRLDGDVLERQARYEVQ